MTTQEFLSLSSREQDALVATHVMGLKVVHKSWDYEYRGKTETGHQWSIGEPIEHYTSDEPGGYLANPLPEYTLEIAAAWDVVVALQERRWAIILDNISHRLGSWQAQFERERHEIFTAETCDTAPLAICLAALKAAGFLED